MQDNSDYIERFGTAKRKDILVIYQGGGYDGCFWEWNGFCIDQEGYFRDLYSSGRAGINNRKAAVELLDRTSNGMENNVYVVDLHADVAVWRYVDTEFSAHLLYGLYRRLAKLDIETTAGLHCDHCGCFVPAEALEDDLHLTGLSGDGGIAMSYKQKYCDQCWSSHMCRICECFYGPSDDAFDIDLSDAGLCWHHRQFEVFKDIWRMKPEVLGDFSYLRQYRPFDDDDWSFVYDMSSEECEVVDDLYERWLEEDIVEPFGVEHLKGVDLPGQMYLGKAK